MNLFLTQTGVTMLGVQKTQRESPRAEPLCDSLDDPRAHQLQETDSAQAALCCEEGIAPTVQDMATASRPLPQPQPRVGPCVGAARAQSADSGIRLKRLHAQLRQEMESRSLGVPKWLLAETREEGASGIAGDDDAVRPEEPQGSPSTRDESADSERNGLASSQSQLKRKRRRDCCEFHAAPWHRKRREQVAYSQGFYAGVEAALIRPATTPAQEDASAQNLARASASAATPTGGGERNERASIHDAQVLAASGMNLRHTPPLADAPSLMSVTTAGVSDSVLSGLDLRGLGGDTLHNVYLGRTFKKHEWVLETEEAIQKVLLVTGGNDCVKKGKRPKCHIDDSIVEKLHHAIRHWTDRNAKVRVVCFGDGAFWRHGFHSHCAGDMHVKRFDGCMRTLQNAVAMVPGADNVWLKEDVLRSLPLLVDNDHFAPGAANAVCELLRQQADDMEGGTGV